MALQTLKTFITLSAFLLLAVSSHANEIVIQDTAGFTRAVSPVDQFGSVEFNMVTGAGAPADGVEIVLTNTATGESISSVAANGTALFEGIEAGTWTVASSAADVTFTGVNISSAAALGGAGIAGAGAGLGGISGATGGTVAAAAGVGAVGAGAVAISESNDDDDDSKGSLSDFQ